MATPSIALFHYSLIDSARALRVIVTDRSPPQRQAQRAFGDRTESRVSTRHASSQLPAMNEALVFMFELDGGEAGPEREKNAIGVGTPAGVPPARKVA
jgi:hypothetical protein